MIAAAVGITGWYKFYRDVPQPSWITSDRQDTFLNGWIASNGNSGIPYWIWLALPRMFPEYIHYPGGYAALGISWEQGKEMPAGFAKKTIGYTRVSGNCALCHAASYRKGADEVPEVVATVPGHAMDIERLLVFFQQCAQDPRFNASEILAEVSMASKLSILDKLIYRFILIPQTRRALLDKRALIDPELLAHSGDPHTESSLFAGTHEGPGDLDERVQGTQVPSDDQYRVWPQPASQSSTTRVAVATPMPGTRLGTIIPIPEIGTDQDMVKQGGYVAPSLDGIWLRGPYLHNGSVPTVGDLLKPQAQRPAVFFPGNDLLDL